ncbi:MAG: hypothetical protein ABUS79_29300 [Pseudomonadota bacterium]
MPVASVPAAFVPLPAAFPVGKTTLPTSANPGQYSTSDASAKS